jgi:hypothetical protein
MNPGKGPARLKKPNFSSLLLKTDLKASVPAVNQNPACLNPADRMITADK